MRNVANEGSSARMTSVTKVIAATTRSTMLNGLIIASLIRTARLFSLPKSMMFLPYSSRRSDACTGSRPSSSVLYFSKRAFCSKLLSSSKVFSTSLRRSGFSFFFISISYVFALQIIDYIKYFCLQQGKSRIPCGKRLLFTAVCHYAYLCLRTPGRFAFCFPGFFA